MSLDLNNLLPWYWKLGIFAVITLGIFGLGWHYGSNDVQASWDKAKADQVVASDKIRQHDQAGADSAAADTEAKLAAQRAAIINQPKELSDATIKIGVCGGQPLSADSVRLYSYAAGR